MTMMMTKTRVSFRNSRVQLTKGIRNKGVLQTTAIG